MSRDEKQAGEAVGQRSHTGGRVMGAERGDRKPCTHEACSGTMQFGREPQQQVSFKVSEGRRGWVCSENDEHFQTPSQRGRSDDARMTRAQSGWDDDGGSPSKGVPTLSRP